VVEIIREFNDVQAAQRGISVYLVGFKDHYNLSESTHVRVDHPEGK
jgi:hypothetical protein